MKIKRRSSVVSNRGGNTIPVGHIYALFEPLKLAERATVEPWHVDVYLDRSVSGLLLPLFDLPVVTS